MTALHVERCLPEGYLDRALRADARAGLTASPKTLPPKWLYDENGSELFEKITQLDEYYPTRAERSILVAVADEESRASSEAVATALRSRGVPCEVAAGAQKFGKQIRYAERRGIPWVWFPGTGGPHEVKDIRTGNQVEADPATWQPPAEDLHPQVSTGPTTEEEQLS